MTCRDPDGSARFHAEADCPSSAFVPTVKEGAAVRAIPLHAQRADQSISVQVIVSVAGFSLQNVFSAVVQLAASQTNKR